MEFPPPFAVEETLKGTLVFIFAVPNSTDVVLFTEQT